MLGEALMICLTIGSSLKGGMEIKGEACKLGFGSACKNSVTTAGTKERSFTSGKTIAGNLKL